MSWDSEKTNPAAHLLSLERHRKMKVRKAPGSVYRTGRLSILTVAALVSVLAAGCANKDGLSTGSIPDDYRTRHPIVIGEAEKTIDIPVASGSRHLLPGQREVIAGFAANYRSDSTGAIQIIAPHGSVNSSAAHTASKEIRSLLVRMGIPSQRIISTVYSAGESGDAAPIRLSYVAIAAHTAPCGEWPEDLTLNTTQNRNYYNFGCASQSNLAAQIANPNDLLGPRRMTPPDATARGKAVERYRDSYLELRDLGD